MGRADSVELMGPLFFWVLPGSCPFWIKRIAYSLGFFDLHIQFLPQVWKVLSYYFFIASFSLFSFWKIHYPYLPFQHILPFLMESDNFLEFPPFIKNIIALSSTWVTSRFLYSSSLILFSIWSALLPVLSHALKKILFIEFFSSRICLLLQNFIISIFLAKYCFYSLILFLSSLNCFSELPYSSLSFFMIAVLNSLSFRLQYSITLSLISGKLSFFVCLW